MVELIAAGPGGYRGADNQKQLVLHTHWGGKLNHPWALALQSAWQERYGERVELHADNDAIVLQPKSRRKREKNKRYHLKYYNISQVFS